jgi:hypothetical protein
LYDAMSTGGTELDKSAVEEVVNKAFKTKDGGLSSKQISKMRDNKKAFNRALLDSGFRLEGASLEDLSVLGKAKTEVDDAFEDAPSEVKPDLRKMIRETKTIQTGIGDIEKKLEKADVTPFDYDDIQRRAGQILIKQEEPEEIGKLPDDEAAYARSLPEAFKYAGKKSLSEYGTVGNFVDKMFEAQEKNPDKRKPWAELITAAKKETADPAQYRTAVAMMASRLLRAVEESGD